MNLRLTYMIIFSVFGTLQGYSQDPYFSNFALNLVYLNPSYVSSITNPEIAVSYRNQWPALSGAFVNYGAYVSFPLKKFQSGFGFYFMNDIQGGGIITSTSLNSIYAYKIKINNNINLNAGLQASYFFENMNPENLVFESDLINTSGPNYADEAFDILDNNFWDFSLGFMAEVNRLVYIGFSVQHLTQPGRYFSSDDNNTLFRKYSFHAQSQIPLIKGNSKNVPVITPSILFQKHRQHQQINYGSGLLISPLYIGIWAKNNLKFNFSSLTVAAGFIKTNYKIVYNYDFNLTRSNLLDLGMGAHEITFLLNFQYKEKRRNNRQ
jgi:type IX secretion system PorP/SprF family membrane protein